MPFYTIGCGERSDPQEDYMACSPPNAILYDKSNPPYSSLRLSQAKSMKSIASTSVLSDTDVSPMPPTSLAVFALGDVFTALCPGIAQCCGGGGGG